VTDPILENLLSQSFGFIFALNIVELEVSRPKTIFSVGLRESLVLTK
jgi:hypothetical protein